MMQLSTGKLDTNAATGWPRPYLLPSLERPRRTLPPRIGYAGAARGVGSGVSEVLGRRPVLLVALATLMASSVLFMVAGSAAWLFIARGLQGLATGAALGAARWGPPGPPPTRDP